MPTTIEFLYGGEEKRFATKLERFARDIEEYKAKVQEAQPKPNQTGHVVIVEMEEAPTTISKSMIQNAASRCGFRQFKTSTATMQVVPQTS